MDSYSSIELMGNKWAPIVRYDTAHGYLHKDLYASGQNGTAKKEQLPIHDLNRGLTEAIDDLKRQADSTSKCKFW